MSSPNQIQYDTRTNHNFTANNSFLGTFCKTCYTWFPVFPFHWCGLYCVYLSSLKIIYICLFSLIQIKCMWNSNLSFLFYDVFEVKAKKIQPTHLKIVIYSTIAAWLVLHTVHTSFIFAMIYFWLSFQYCKHSEIIAAIMYDKKKIEFTKIYLHKIKSFHNCFIFTLYSDASMKSRTKSTCSSK